MALAIRPVPGSWDNDTVTINQVGRFAFSDLGWQRDTNQTTVGVLDLGLYLPVVQSGQLSVNINDDTAADFALVSLTVASETTDSQGASVWIAGGGRVTVDSCVPRVGQVEVSGSGSRLNVDPGGNLEVIRDVRLDARLQMTEGRCVPARSMISAHRPISTGREDGFL